jgi:hypothetical protein
LASATERPDWANVRILGNFMTTTKIAQIIGHFFDEKVMFLNWQNSGWVTNWAIFPHKHLVALIQPD